MTTRTFALALAGTALISLAAPAGAAAQAPCQVRNNVEAILDDSGSMDLNDPKFNRREAVNQFASFQGNESKTLGATEFGSTANEVFAPAVIGPNRTAFATALNTNVQSNNGGTNYNAAFDFAKSHNANATARIFLTDGEHNAGAYEEGHRGGPPTHVLGLFSTIATEDEDRLKRIASETGGRYRRVTGAVDIQPAMNDLNAAINCLPQPIDLVTSFSKAGQAKTQSVAVARGIRSVRLQLSWEDPADLFAVDRVRVVRGGKVVGRTTAVRKLRVSTRRGATFLNVKVSRVVRGRLRFRVRARRLGSGRVSVKLTTQAIRTKRR